jgi:hypothetical protein
MQALVGGCQDGLGPVGFAYDRQPVHIAGREALVEEGPVPAPVLAAPDATDLDARPDRFTVDRIEQDLGDPGCPRLISEKLFTPGVDPWLQVAPPSSERKSPPGRVPAMISCGSSGSWASAQTSCIGLSTAVHAAPDSLQRNRPMSEPAQRVSGSDGWLENPQTRASV